MPRIRCHYLDCAFLDDGYCSAAAVEIDPDSGCVTYAPSADAAVDDDWEETEELEDWEEVEDDEEDDDDLWMDDEENEY
jgi:hypothetical protein